MMHDMKDRYVRIGKGKKPVKRMTEPPVSTSKESSPKGVASLRRAYWKRYCLEPWLPEEMYPAITYSAACDLAASFGKPLVSITVEPYEDVEDVDNLTDESVTVAPQVCPLPVFNARRWVNWLRDYDSWYKTKRER